MKQTSLARLCGALFLASFFSAAPASAVPNFSATNLGALSSGDVDLIVKTVAIGTDHRAYMPASSLGIAIGFDGGIELTAISVPSDFAKAIATATGRSVDDVPSALPIPKLNLHKGLPWGLDAGFSFAKYQDVLRFFGLELKWAFFEAGPALPALAVRMSYSNTKLWFVKTHATTFELEASKDLFFVEPYAGLGLRFISGELSGLSNSVSSTDPHFYVGIPVKLVLVRLTLQLERSFGGVTTYGAKVSVSL